MSIKKNSIFMICQITIIFMIIICQINIIKYPLFAKLFHYNQ